MTHHREEINQSPPRCAGRTETEAVAYSCQNPGTHHAWGTHWCDACWDRINRARGLLNTEAKDNT